MTFCVCGWTSQKHLNVFLKTHSKSWGFLFQETSQPLQCKCEVTTHTNKALSDLKMKKASASPGGLLQSRTITRNERHRKSGTCSFRKPWPRSRRKTSWRKQKLTPRTSVRLDNPCLRRMRPSSKRSPGKNQGSIWSTRSVAIQINRKAISHGTAKSRRSQAWP